MSSEEDVADSSANSLGGLAVVCKIEVCGFGCGCEIEPCGLNSVKGVWLFIIGCCWAKGGRNVDWTNAAGCDVIAEVVTIEEGGCWVDAESRSLGGGFLQPPRFEGSSASFC